MAIQLMTMHSIDGSLPFRVARGHFATSHSHINYYIDLTLTKHRLSEARLAASILCGQYQSSTPFSAWMAPRSWAPALPAPSPKRAT